jgi:cytochrome c oxidase subunit 1
MHVMGLFGVPRRTAEPQYQGFDFVAAFGSITELRLQLAFGATLLFISTLLFVTNIAFSSGTPTISGHGYRLSDPLSGPDDSPIVLDNLKLWFGIAMVLVVLAYTLPLAGIIGDNGLFGGGVDPVPVMIEPLVPLGETVTTKLSAALTGVIA